MSSAPDPINVLEKWGDTLERAICIDTANDLLVDCNHFAGGFRPVLDIYAAVWHYHILCRRDRCDLSRLAPIHQAWVNFSASQYTSLVKLHQAYRKLFDIVRCCQRTPQGGKPAALL